MPRWDPDAETRLAASAIGLFRERGYESVTIADITERAGLTRRSFFRYFPDKREVLFAGSTQIPAKIEAAVAGQSAELSARDAALTTLTEFGHFLLQDLPAQALRQELIDSSAELQERERTKLASIATAIANGLSKRGIDSADAPALGAVAVAIFHSAFVRSVRETNPEIFDPNMETAMSTIRQFLAK